MVVKMIVEQVDGSPGNHPDARTVCAVAFGGARLRRRRRPRRALCPPGLPPPAADRLAVAAESRHAPLHGQRCSLDRCRDGSPQHIAPAAGQAGLESPTKSGRRSNRSASSCDDTFDLTRIQGQGSMEHVIWGRHEAIGNACDEQAATGNLRCWPDVGPRPGVWRACNRVAWEQHQGLLKPKLTVRTSQPGD